MSRKTEEPKNKKNNLIKNLVNIIHKEETVSKKSADIKPEKLDETTSKKKTTKKKDIIESDTATKAKNSVAEKTKKATKKGEKKSAVTKSKFSAKDSTKALTKVSTKALAKTSTKALTKTSGKKNVSVVTTKKSLKNSPVVEYYDLPYRYNETIVKILYQTPTTLFVYWDISDEDREKYIKQYGENFFNITRPVLIVHNTTMNYSFEVPINDFANSWYLHVNDSKCDYKVELGRRPNHYNEEATKEIEKNIHTDYIYVTTSNEIESPNDHILFNTNENNTVKIRNVKNQEEKSISLIDIIKNLPVEKNKEDIPYISEEILKELYSSIYQNEDISFFERISNPSSSGNPTSGNIHARI